MIPVNNLNDLTDRAAEPTGPEQSETPPKAPSAGALVSIAGRQVLVGVRLLLAMTVVLGIAYPLLVLGVGKAIASTKADGSLIRSGDTVVGSSLIGQNFADPQWFQGRPSAAGADGYDPTASGGSNLAADSDTLLQSVQERKAAVAQANGVNPADVPPDALTASGSGLDPDISPAYALIQVNRVAAARQLNPATVRDLVQAHTQQPLLGFIGQQRVNVLELNLALQSIQPGS